MKAILGALALSLAVAACGGSSAKTKTVTVSQSQAAQATNSAASTTSTAVGGTTTRNVGGETCIYGSDGTIQSCKSNPKPTSCAAKGITDTALKQGTCKANGQSVTVVNSDSTLKLKTLTLHLNGIKTANSLSGNDGTASAVAHGEFVIVNVTVSNRLDSPQTFDNFGDQTELLLDHRQYTEDFSADNGPDNSSCESAESPIQPEETATCDAVFDVPPSQVHLLSTLGNFVVLNFGDSTSNGAVGTLGILRTYHPVVPITQS